MPIEPDENLLREVGQIINGRLIHDRNAWTYSYQYRCQQGDVEGVERMKKKLEWLLVESRKV